MGRPLVEETVRLSASYHTLGCKLNFAETATLAGRLSEHGVREARRGETPDLCVINTCSVTATADKKARTLIRRLAAKYPEAKIAVTGCYAQLKPEEVAAIEGVDLVLGSAEKSDPSRYLELLRGAPKGSGVAEIARSENLEDFSPSCSRGERTRFFLKVQDGCDYFCTYCTIPFARGRSRSGRIDDLVDMARDAAMQGGKEIVITGVNIGDFGKNTGEEFLDLLKRLDEVEGIERYRISSIEPNLLTDEIIRWVATDSRAFMPHFHIPLQSGSDYVLRKMNRRYATALFADKVTAVRELLPEAFLGVDVIAGARGETPEEWEKSRDFIASLPVSRLHVFPYSERPGTAALHLAEAVTPAERNRRAASLIEISDKKVKDFMLANVGNRRKVLWEHPLKEGELMSGLTDNYIRVVAPLRREMLNTVSTVRLEGIYPEGIETMKGEHL